MKYNAEKEPWVTFHVGFIWTDYTFHMHAEKSF